MDENVNGFADAVDFVNANLLDSAVQFLFKILSIQKMMGQQDGCSWNRSKVKKSKLKITSFGLNNGALARARARG